MSSPCEIIYLRRSNKNKQRARDATGEPEADASGTDGADVEAPSLLEQIKADMQEASQPVAFRIQL